MQAEVVQQKNGDVWLRLRDGRGIRLTNEEARQVFTLLSQVVFHRAKVTVQR